MKFNIIVIACNRRTIKMIKYKSQKNDLNVLNIPHTQLCVYLELGNIALKARAVHDHCPHLKPCGSTCLLPTAAAAATEFSLK